MHSQKKYPRSFSFEFFPPKTEEQKVALAETVETLAAVKPAFFSVTFGAGGSTRQGTYETVKDIVRRGLKAAPHISCLGTRREEIRALLNAYRELGIDHLVVLRGDYPKDSSARPLGDFRYANELVSFVREDSGDYFHIDVAAYPEFHPEAPSAEADLQNFARKVRAGANSAMTQYFFNPEAYFRFVADCERLGLDLPIVPGIMPITNYKQLARFSDNCGAEIPRWIRRRLEAFGDDLESIRAFGLDVVTRLCEQLLAGGAPGLHFYTLNRAAPVLAIWQRLGL